MNGQFPATKRTIFHDTLCTTLNFINDGMKQGNSRQSLIVSARYLPDEVIPFCFGRSGFGVLRVPDAGWSLCTSADNR
jgi:hypothetical protein